MIRQKSPQSSVNARNAKSCPTAGGEIEPWWTFQAISRQGESIRKLAPRRKQRRVKRYWCEVRDVLLGRFGLQGISSCCPEVVLLAGLMPSITLAMLYYDTTLGAMNRGHGGMTYQTHHLGPSKRPSLHSNFVQKLPGHPVFFSRCI